MIEIKSVDQQELQGLLAKGYLHAVTNIKKSLKINLDNYHLTGEFSQEQGYGFRCFVVHGNEDYSRTMKELDLFISSTLEDEVAIYEDDGKVCVRKLFLSSSDSGYLLFLFD